MVGEVALISQLAQSIKSLELTIDAARECIAEKHGESHPIVIRLDNHFLSIARQKKYIQQLKQAIMRGNINEMYRIANIINSISAMIQDDAREIVLEMNGTTCTPDKDLLQ